MIRQVYKECVDHGTIRAKGYRYLCLSAFRHCGQGIEEEDRVLRAIEADYLAAEGAVSQVTKRLQEAGFDATPDIRTAIDDVSTAINEMRDVFRSLGAQVTIEAIANGYRIQSEQIFPSFSRFLDVLAKALEIHEEEEELQSKKVVDDALHQFDKVSDTINIIAINASVEAARLGDSGRGFSVIADEIKQLSKRAKERAKVIRTHLDR